MRRRQRLWAVTVALAGGLAGAAVATPPTPPIRGIVISTHTNGREWGTAAMRSTVADIRQLGATWICTHPYAGIRADGTVLFHHRNNDAPPPHVARPVTEAHAQGMQAFIKPHLAHWGSGFGWRGAIQFDTPDAWQRFFASYTEWIVGVAAACPDADAFAVGTELDATVHFEADWRRLIARVRQVTDAPLTYAANWDRFAEVPFWDALDLIGVQAYFPVSVASEPSDHDLANGWVEHMARLAKFSRKAARPIVFTELGYNRSLKAASQPWDHATDPGAAAAELQARCLTAALTAVEAEPAVVGAFLWKWFPNPYSVGRTFPLATPAIEGVIRNAWASGSN